MKRLYVAIGLLMFSFCYALVKITNQTPYLSKISIDSDVTPIDYSLIHISIDTGFFDNNDPRSIYTIWMFPIYFLVFIAMGLTLWTIVHSLVKKYET